MQPTTIVLAGDLTLDDATYSFARGETPRHVMLVADRLRLAGKTVFDLSGYAVGSPGQRGVDALDRAGGTLTIFVRDLIVASGSRLILRSDGGRGPEEISLREHWTGLTRTTSDNPHHGGGHGGDLIVAVRRVRLRAADDGPLSADGASFENALGSALVLDASPGGAGPGLPTGDRGRLTIGSSWEDLVAELEGRDLSRFGFGVGIPSVARWARRATSEWLVASLEHAVARLHDSLLEGRDEGAAEAHEQLARTKALVRDAAPLRAQERPRCAELVARLGELAESLGDAAPEAAAPDLLGTAHAFGARVVTVRVGATTRTTSRRRSNPTDLR